jgi:uncharacterized membrane protein
MDDDNSKPSPRRRTRWLTTPFRVIRTRPRLFVCALIGIVSGLLLPNDMREVTRALISWNVAVLIYLAASARVIAASTHETIRRRARFQDEGRTAVLFLAAATACASIGAIIAELGPVKNMSGLPKAEHLGLTILTVLDSWLFMHLTFAFHYAHEYYLERAAASPDKKATERGGLIFPATELPQYVDFLYFAYVIGVACQTADVETASPTMRAIALVHGVLSFFYNTTILALVVNISSGFI